MKLLDKDILAQNLNTAMEADLADCRIGGASVTVYQEGQTPFSACWGYRDTEKQLPMQPGTLFRLASMTKPVTAAAVLLQIGRGKLDLNDEVSEYIPSFADKWVGRMEGGKVVPDHKAKTPIRILHLLTHTSGILAADEIGTKQPFFPADPVFDLAHNVDYFGEHILLSNDPMEKAMYSWTAAFDVAARIVELTSDKSFSDFLKENFFDPMGMTDTGFFPSDGQWERMTEMHNRVDGKNASVDMKRYTFGVIPLTYTCAGASLTATVEDYAKFARMLLDEGTFEGREILSPDMIRLMRTPHIPETVMNIGKGETWGLGVRVIKDDPFLGRGCFGWSGAYGTHFWVDPENRLYAIYAKNSCYDGGSGAQTARQFERCVAGALRD